MNYFPPPTPKCQFKSVSKPAVWFRASGLQYSPLTSSAQLRSEKSVNSLEVATATAGPRLLSQPAKLSLFGGILTLKLNRTT